MLFEHISDTNNPKIQSRSDGGKLRFKGPGILYTGKEKRIKKWFSKMSTTETRDHEPFILNTFLTMKDSGNFSVLRFIFPIRCVQRR